MRQDLEFDAEGTTLKGGCMRVPDGGERPAPTVVICHGYSAVKGTLLDAFAEVFAEAGLRALVYDNRNLGSSDGEPRQRSTRGRRSATTATRSRTRSRVRKSTASGSRVWDSSYSGAQVLLVMQRSIRPNPQPWFEFSDPDQGQRRSYTEAQNWGFATWLVPFTATGAEVGCLRKRRPTRPGAHRSTAADRRPAPVDPAIVLIAATSAAGVAGAAGRLIAQRSVSSAASARSISRLVRSPSSPPGPTISASPRRPRAARRSTARGHPRAAPRRRHVAGGPARRLLDEPLEMSQRSAPVESGSRHAPPASKQQRGGVAT